MRQRPHAAPLAALAVLAMARNTFGAGVPCSTSHDPLACCQKWWTMEDLAAGRFIFYDETCSLDGGGGCGAHGAPNCRFCYVEPCPLGNSDCVPCPATSRLAGPIGCDCLEKLTPDQRDVLEANGLSFRCDPRCAADADPQEDPYFPTGCGYMGIGPVCRSCVVDSAECILGDFACVPCDSLPQPRGGRPFVSPNAAPLTANNDGVEVPYAAAAGLDDDDAGEPAAAAAAEIAGPGTCRTAQDCYDALAFAHPKAINNLEAWGKRVTCDAGCSSSPPTQNAYGCNYYGVAMDCRTCWTEAGVQLHLAADPSFPSEDIVRCPQASPNNPEIAATVQPDGEVAVGDEWDDCVELGEYCGGPYHAGPTECCDATWRCVEVSQMHWECVKPSQ